MESQHSVGVLTCRDFPRFIIISEKSRPEVGSRVNIFTQSCFSGKKDPLRANFHKCFLKGIMATYDHVLCANFVKFGWSEIGKVVRYLLGQKNSARSPALASARIAPKYRNILWSTVRKQLNRSWCRLGCGLGWAVESASSTLCTRWRQRA